MIETFGFKIGLSGTYWGNRKPQYRISLSGKECCRGTISAASGEVEYFEFRGDFEEGKTYRLEISLLNKIPKLDVVKDSEGNITKDFLLNVESVEIDGIDISSLRHGASRYELDQPQEYQGRTVTELTNCVNLGFNGTYVLEFTVPFYLWLLDNI